MAALVVGVAGMAAILAGQPDEGGAPRKPSVLWKVAIKSASFGGGAVGEVNGKPVVAFATYFGDAKVRVLRGVDGEEVWSFNEGDHCYDASVRFFDLDGDGKTELIAPCSDTSKVFAFDAATGNVKWERKLGTGECIDTPPFVGEVDGEAGPEIVVGTFKGKLWVLGADGKVKRSVNVAPGAVQSCPLVMDLNGDGARDFIAANFRGDHALHGISGADGSEMWKVQTGDHIYHGASVVRGAPWGDMVVVGSYDGHVYGAVAKTGELKWKVKTGDRYIMAPTTALDVDGDGRDEVVSTSQKITLIDADGNIVWQKPGGVSDNTAGVTRGVAVADLDGDGALDLAYLDDAGGFKVRRAKDGVMIYELDAGAYSEGSIEGDNAPVIADLNDDGKLDVFFVVGVGAEQGRKGMAVALTGFEGKGKPWRMFRHDTGNTGNVRTE